MAESTSRVALLGDLVSSRDAPDRAAVHAAVLAALALADAHTAPVSPLRVTVGDEFQGVYAHLGEALKATHLVRLALAGHSDVRFGLGVGAIADIDPGRGIQDGSAWWTARAAIEAVETSAARASHAALRTGLDAADTRAIGPGVRAAATALDAALAGMSEATRSILLTLVTGGRQADAAHLLGVTPQAVNRQVSTHRLALVADAMHLLWEAT